MLMRRLAALFVRRSLLYSGFSDKNPVFTPNAVELKSMQASAQELERSHGATEVAVAAT